MNDAQRQAIKKRQRAMVGADPDDSDDERTRGVPAPAPLRPMEEIAAELRPDVGDGIPVKYARFVDKTFQLPGMPSGDDFTARTERNGRVHKLELVRFGDATCFLQTFIDPARRSVEFTFIERSAVKTWKIT